jgi:hypothetical protein
VCLAAKIEVKVVIGTSGTLEDTHGSARGRTSVVRNKFPDGIGTKHHPAPDCDAGDFLALNPVSERALGDAEDLRRLGTLSRGSITSSNGAGVGCAGRGSVAMVFSLRNLILGASLAAGGVFDRDVARRSQGQESAAGLVRTALCKPEGDFRQTRSLTRVEANI